MASEYYQSVIKKGLQQGLDKGKTQGARNELASAIMRILQRRLGSVSEEVRQRVMRQQDLDTLREWQDMVADAVDAESAQRVVQFIRTSGS